MDGRENPARFVQQLNSIRVRKRRHLFYTSVSSLVMLMSGSQVRAIIPTVHITPIAPFKNFEGDDCKVDNVDSWVTTKGTSKTAKGTKITIYEATCESNTRSPYPDVFVIKDDPNGTRSSQELNSVKANDAAVFGFYAAAKAEDPFIVGRYNQTVASNAHAFRYDIDTGELLDLGYLNHGTFTISTGKAIPEDESEALGVNYDGSVVVGDSTSTAIETATITGDPSFPATHAFRWTQTTGMVDLGSLIGASGTSSATAVSDDGTVVVGKSENGSFENPSFNSLGTRIEHAFRWVLTDPATGAGSFTDLGQFGGGSDRNSGATAVSADGSVVAGSSEGTIPPANPDANPTVFAHAFRWTQATGMVDLGTTPGQASSFANAMSADGQIIVGSSTSFPLTFASDPLDYGSDPSTYPHAFRWTQATGIQDLNTLMSSAGVDLTGTTLLIASTISRDGQFIGGVGIFPGSTVAQAYVIRYVDATNGSNPPQGTDANPGPPSSSSGSPPSSPPASPPVSPPTSPPVSPPSSPPSTPPIVGITTAASVAASIHQLGDARRKTFVQEFSEAAALLGANERIGSGSEAGAFFTGGSEGSVAGGASGRIAYGNGVTVLGGIAGGWEDYGHVQTDALFMAALAARYFHDTSGLIRPYVEVGGWGMPGGNFSFSRTYANGSGTARGHFSTHGEKYYGYGRLGLTISPPNGDEGVLSAEVGYGALHTSAFGEKLSDQNPFEALGSPATDRMSIVKVRAQWTHSISSKVDLTVWAAGADAFHHRDNLVVVVDGFGSVPSGGPEHPKWLEYGGRIGLKPSPAVRFDAFADAVSGKRDSGIGTEARVGGQVRFLF